MPFPWCCRLDKDLFSQLVGFAADTHRDTVARDHDNSPDVILRCALPKILCDQIRELRGRFDLHTLEAVKLYLL